jgi:hypothetical protein
MHGRTQTINQNYSGRQSQHESLCQQIQLLCPILSVQSEK